MKAKELSQEQTSSLFNYLLRLGDDSLILGHRLAEWCGHGPILEEDIALSNLSLDCIGEAALILKLAGEIEGKARDEDALAYLRDPQEFKNCRFVELPKGDFAFTIARQFFYSSYAYLLFSSLSSHWNESLAGIAQKAVKEMEYHVRHSREWMLRLGDGTEESNKRLQAAISELWEYTADLFLPDESERALAKAGIVPDRGSLRSKWDSMVSSVLTEAKVKTPEPNKFTVARDTRDCRHTEHLGHILSEMQILVRSHPGATW